VTQFFADRFNNPVAYSWLFYFNNQILVSSTSANDVGEYDIWLHREVVLNPGDGGNGLGNTSGSGSFERLPFTVVITACEITSVSFTTGITSFEYDVGSSSVTRTM
jgi:hypothetical protein